MQSVNTQTQYYGIQSYRQSNSDSLTLRVVSHNQSQTNSAVTKPSKKQITKLGISVLAVTTIVLYGFGISELSKTVTGIVATTVQEAVQNYRF